MTIRGHSNFKARQLVLFGAAAIVLLIFMWTLVLQRYCVFSESG
jgi:hypothetical protein